MTHTQRSKLQRPVKADQQTSGSQSGPLTTLFHRQRWNALGRYFIGHAGRKTTLPPMPRSLPPSERLIEEILEGHVTLGNINSNCKAVFESLRGNVVVEHEIQEWVDATLKAHGAVTIGRGVGEHSIVRIIAGAKVLLGESFKRGPEVLLATAGSGVDLDSKAASLSQPDGGLSTTLCTSHDIGPNATTIITAVGDIEIEGNVNENAVADFISLDGAIIIRRILKSNTTALLTASRTVFIGGDVDHHARLTILAKGDITIGRHIDKQSVAYITSIEGSITIEQGIRVGSVATLFARNGSINIGGSIDRGSTVNWDARHFNSRQEDGNVNRL
jgi:hypothetical protein